MDSMLELVYSSGRRSGGRPSHAPFRIDIRAESAVDLAFGNGGDRDHKHKAQGCGSVNVETQNVQVTQFVWGAAGAQHAAYIPTDSD